MGAAGATAKEGARRMRLYLTRHGQTEWNVSQKMQGACDSPLTELGVRQAEQLQKRLELLPVDKAYVSPLKRAMDTARLLVGGRGLELIADKRLSEASLGAFEGLTSNRPGALSGAGLKLPPAIPSASARWETGRIFIRFRPGWRIF